MTLELEILVPDGEVLHQQVSSLRATDATGEFGLRPGHETFVTLLSPSLLAYRDEQGRESYAAVDGGVLRLVGTQVSIATREAVVDTNLESVADRAAQMLSQRQQHEQSARTEFLELQTTLLRELRQAETKP